jgi:hypothetical protein
VISSDWSDHFQPLRFAHNTNVAVISVLKHRPLSAVTVPVKGSRYSIRMLYHESSSKKSSKRSKPGGDSKPTGARGELFTIARTTNQLETIIEIEDNKEDITRLVQSCVLNPT